MRMFADDDIHIYCIIHPSLRNKCQIHVCYMHPKQQILNTLNPSEHMVKCVHGVKVFEKGLQMLSCSNGVTWIENSVFRKVGEPALGVFNLIERLSYNKRLDYSAHIWMILIWLTAPYWITF